MPLAAATRLGPYEVLGLIGAGGMGEVYKARDTRLDRAVALKVFSSEVSADHDRRARFEREARAVAALTHPNILAIHDFGVDHGVSYAVMELLEGETLRERLTRSRMSWRKAVGVAIQVADGVAAAHAKGIVHRDLKPENIFLTASGQAKILDFGLASHAGRLHDGDDVGRRRHATRDRHGHCRLHVARAGTWRRGRAAQRHLLVRLRAVRDAVGARTVRAQYARGMSRGGAAR